MRNHALSFDGSRTKLSGCHNYMLPSVLVFVNGVFVGNRYFFVGPVAWLQRQVASAQLGRELVFDFAARHRDEIEPHGVTLAVVEPRKKVQAAMGRAWGGQSPPAPGAPGTAESGAWPILSATLSARCLADRFFFRAAARG